MRLCPRITAKTIPAVQRLFFSYAASTTINARAIYGLQRVAAPYILLLVLALRRTLARWTRNGTLGAAHFKLMLGTQDAAKADTQDAVGTRQTEGNATQDAGATTGGLQRNRGNKRRLISR